MIWTKTEVEKYKRIRDKDLDLLYHLEGISVDEPNKRKECLTKRMNLTKHNKYHLKKVKIKKGDAVQLRVLENMAKNYFFMAVN